MAILKKINALNAPGKSFEEKLYMVLSKMNFARNGYQIRDLGESMSVIEQDIYGWWKQRYLINHNNHQAFEVMSRGMYFVNFTVEDIDWKSIEKLPEKAISTAEYMFAMYPSFILNFYNGVARVDWQLNPDGRYYMDDDGFGMTSDEEITVYGFIDTNMKVLVKFQYIDDNLNRLSEMRKEAELCLNNRIIV